MKCLIFKAENRMKIPIPKKQYLKTIFVKKVYTNKLWNVQVINAQEESCVIA